MLWLLFPIVVVVASLLTFLLRRYALARSLIDIPNARSSHSVPTPRGGGVAIVICFLASLPLLAFESVLDWSLVWGLIGAGSTVAVLGFLDDHGHIPARWRLLGHFSAAIWSLIWLGGMAPINIVGITFDMGLIGHIFAVFYLVWMLNLYNFMDGIDGIASVEAVTVCCCASFIYVLVGLESLVWAPLLLASAVTGFLFWNFPPARIFMGDAGSGFLGFALGVISIQATWASPKFFWVWLILLGIFIVDATLTLVRRLLRGDKVYEAHRSHAYQFAARYFGRHLPVTLVLGLINLVWLFPIAVCVAKFGLDGLLGVIIAYLPLTVLALRFKAGELER